MVISHYNLVMNTLQLRSSLPLRLHSGVREVFFAPCKFLSSMSLHIGQSFQKNNLCLANSCLLDCHIYGLSVVVFSGMWAGGLFYGLPAFDLETFCRKSAELKVTDMHIVPPVALALVNIPSVETYDLSSVERVVIAAAPLKVSLQRKLKQRFPGASICQGLLQILLNKFPGYANESQGYGLTECSPGVMHQMYDEESSCGSVGKLFAGT